MAKQQTAECSGCADPGAAFARHDHGHCAADVLARAEVLAAEQGARLTPVRKRVLEILLEEHKAMGAYEVLQRLAAKASATSLRSPTGRWTSLWIRALPTASGG